MKKSISLVLSVVMILSCCFGVDLSAFASDLYEIHISGTYDYDRAAEVLELVNEERAAEGLSELTMDAELLDAAMLRATECSFYFSHTRPDTTSCSTVCSKLTGENISAGCSTAEKTVEYWMESAGHKANILGSSYKSIGIGCFKTNGTYYWVQCFSTQAAETVPDCSGTVSELVNMTVPCDAIELYLGISYTSSQRSLYYAGSNTVYRSAELELFCGYKNQGWTTIAQSVASDFTFESSDESVIQVDSNGIMKAVGEGTATITLSFNACPEITYSKDITVVCNDINSNISIKGISSKYEYTGSEITPLPQVYYYYLHLITENVDYTVSYSNNINSGTATITLNGIGRYDGTREITFTIVHSTHEYTISTEEPTCEEVGKTIYTCACGYSYYEEISATGHNYISTVTKDATCSDNGIMTYTCLDCGDCYTEEIPARHNYVSSMIDDATCTDDGQLQYICSECGDIYTETVPATGHSYTSVTTIPTCTEDGYTTYTCSVCGDTYIDNIVPATGHNYKSTVTKTIKCYEAGERTYTCSSCGDSYTEELPAGHYFGNNNKFKYCLLGCGTLNPDYAASSSSKSTDSDSSYSDSDSSKTDSETSSSTSTSTSTEKPKKTAIKKLTKKSKAFKVTWTKKSNVTGYQVQYATNKKFTKNKKTVTVKGASKTSKTIKGLKSKKTYYVRVRTYKTVNGKKVYSNWSTVKKVTTK